MSGQRSRITSAARSPSSVNVGGILTSMTHTSGVHASTARISASASVAAATTSWPASASRRVSPSRSRTESSAIATLSMAAPPR